MPNLRALFSVPLIACLLFAAPARAQEYLNEERSDFRQAKRGEPGDETGRVREVRLALVCYGGSSLAIYIHGNTKEFFRLVQASKALEQDAKADAGRMQQEVASGGRPEPGRYGQKLTGSAREWYRRLLALWIADEHKVRTRVLIDVIAGTSAGGINGVILAKALAHDLPVDDLTALWLDKASLAKLTNGYFGLFRVLVNRPPVDGNALLGWLYDALDRMDRQELEHEKAPKERYPSLLPRGYRLDLFVTATDRFGYPQNLLVGSPPFAVEKRLRHVMHFVYSGVNRGCRSDVARPRGELDHFCPEWTPALAFAARATSSIPGVFPPLKLDEALGRIRSEAAPTPSGYPPAASTDGVVESFFRNYQLQEPEEKGTYATNTYFVDGGVLDNHPFGPAIEEILRRPQDQEVRRLLVYLQPDPGSPPAPVTPGSAEEKKRNREQGLLKTIWAGLSGLRGSQPILDDFEDIRDHNRSVDRIRDIVRAEERAARLAETVEGEAEDCRDFRDLPIAQRLGCAIIPDFRPGQLTERLLTANQDDLRWGRLKVEKAAEVGFGDPEAQGRPEARQSWAERALDAPGRSYYTLRVHSVLNQFVTVIAGGCKYPPESGQRALLEEIFGRWALDEKLIGDEEELDSQRQQREKQKALLEDFDIGYQRRQLRFVVDWIDQQYGDDISIERRAALDRLKSAAADRIEALTGLIRGTSNEPELLAELGRLSPVFCRLRPWPRAKETAVPLDRQAGEFLADPAKRQALASARTELGRILREAQQRQRDLSFKRFLELAVPPLSPEERSEILVRYMGFPFWDRQIYPYVAFSNLGEFRKIDVYRLSPNDAALLGERTAREALQGATLGHFGAFLSRRGRESDYLWGRLDAADRLLDLMEMDTSGAGGLLSSILDEERTAKPKQLVRESILKAREAEIDARFPN